jgi:hypothetical protein
MWKRDIEYCIDICHCGLYPALIGFICGLSYPKGVIIYLFYSISRGFLSTWYQSCSTIQSMATNKDRIEKLELEIQELKEVMQKMNTESQSKFAELKELFFKVFEHGESFADKGNRSFMGHKNHSSGHSNGSKGSSNFTKLEFPRYLGDGPNVWLNWVVQYFNYK